MHYSQCRLHFTSKENPENKAPVGFRCNFCVEVHPTLRAICNHLRKHVQYGEVKQGHVKVIRVTFLCFYIFYCHSI